MSVLEQLMKTYPTQQFLIADGFDDAIMGLDIRSGRLIYSVSECLEILAKDMPMEDAIEYFDYNVRGGYVGIHTPIWHDDFEH